jgi:RNA recognition motif-containing protein
MNIFVGNLPYSITSDSLEEMFTSFGRVLSARVITDMYSGKSKGFGFVEMESREDAEKAIAELNEREFDGRNIVVNEARSKEGGSGRQGGGGGGGGDRRRKFSGGGGGGGYGGGGGARRGR